MASVDHKGTFSWKIEDQSQVRTFLNAKPTQHFSSAIFEIGGLKWQMYAYPAGKYRIRHDGRATYPQEGCELHLKLLPNSWPRNVFRIIFAYRLFCSAANSSFTNLETFVRNQDGRYFVHWFRGTLTVDELAALEGQIVNLECYINILRMESRNKSIIYQYPYPIESLQNRYEFEWKINDIQGLFVNTKCGKHLESDIFNNFWCLRIAPRGWKLQEQKYVTAWLQLCALPVNLFKVYAKYTLRCKELNISYTGNKYWSYVYKGTNAPWNQHALITDNLRRIKGDTLTFQCQIIILKKYYLRGYRPENRNEAPMQNGQPQYVRKGTFGVVNNQSIQHIQHQKPQNMSNHQDDKKSPELDEMRQQITRLNQKVADMQQMINNLQFTVGTIMHNINNNTHDDEKMHTEAQMDGDGNGPGFVMNGKMEPIEVWLRYSVKLPQYIPLFQQNGICMDVVKSGTLVGDDLKDLGINKYDREKIMAAIKKMEDMEQHQHIMDPGGGENAYHEGVGNMIPPKYPTPTGDFISR